jgi:glycosyltransferase involved in cell wall biosynthesis
MTSGLRYAVITPARNEADNLPRLAESLRSQSLHPLVWLIVDNGSTDATPQVVTGLSEGLEWVYSVRAAASDALVRGGTVTRAFHAGLDALDELPEIVVKVDADVSFPPDYFARLLEAFAADPRLGIGSGICLERSSHGDWRPRFGTGESAWGAARAYRRECLADVLPLEDRMGWDGIDSLRASLHGWLTLTLPDLSFRHHRREGERDGSRLRAWAAQGKASHYMGYRWWYLLVRALHHARKDPTAVAMISGFVQASLRREARCSDEQVRQHLRRQQNLRTLPLRLRETRGHVRRPSASVGSRTSNS